MYLNCDQKFDDGSASKLKGFPSDEMAKFSPVSPSSPRRPKARQDSECHWQKSFILIDSIKFMLINRYR
jgi:hypothetical protein